jgi:hypothetical protein
LKLVIAGLIALLPLHAASRADLYYAHRAVEDRYGVIAPWYKEQNGHKATDLVYDELRRKTGSLK